MTLNCRFLVVFSLCPAEMSWENNCEIRLNICIFFFLHKIYFISTLNNNKQYVEFQFLNGEMFHLTTHNNRPSKRQ